jgi:long-chain acyl-CoA synthetase
MAGRCAAGLRRLGVREGDRVSVVLPNSVEFVASLFACARLDVVMSPLDPLTPREQLLRFVKDAGARVVVTDVAAAVAGTDAAVVEFGSVLAELADPRERDDLRGPALYLYTSGSTDSWKRLCCTQENLFYEARNFVESAGLTAEDNILCTVPLHHSYGLGNCLLDAVYAGSTLVLPEPDGAPFSARCGQMLELMQREGVRVYPGVPYQFQILAELPGDSPTPVSDLKLCISSGDVLPRQTYERFLRRYGQPIRSLYGSTEAGSICIDLRPAEVLQFGSLGPPLANVEIRIRDDAGRELAAGESGEIWVKSPVIPPTGYDNRADLTAQAFRDGYFKTGDFGKVDARGYLVMTGRKQSFVEVGGRKVDLGEVEEVLGRHPKVCEAAALGVEVPRLGTVIKAVVSVRGTCGAGEIRAHCRAALAAFKVPRVIEVRRDALPRSPLGKVLRSELGDVSGYLRTLEAGDFADVWLAAGDDAAQQIELLAAEIQKQAALTLECEPAQVDRSRSFSELGFDSLQATELHLRLSRVTGVKLSITLLWNYPSIDELAKALWARMTAKPTGEEAQGPAPTLESAGASRLEDLLAEVEGLSEADGDASLGRR